MLSLSKFDIKEKSAKHKQESVFESSISNCYYANKHSRRYLLLLISTQHCSENDNKLLNRPRQAIIWHQNKTVYGKPHRRIYQKKNHCKKLALKLTCTMHPKYCKISSTTEKFSLFIFIRKWSEDGFRTGSQ